MIKPNYVQGEYKRGLLSLGKARRYRLYKIDKRGNSHEETKERRLELEDGEPITSIITQLNRKPNGSLINQRLFSLSPNRWEIDKLLPPLGNQHLNKKTLVLDLDETLVHSGFEPFNPSDIVISINLARAKQDIHVLIRPGVAQFLEKMGRHYEIVIFTASIAQYADPVLNILDPNRYCAYRLYREACTSLNGNYVKDLKRLNRDLKNVIIVDNSPMSYAFNKDNGFPIKSWYDDKNDKELYAISHILEFLSKVNDVRDYLAKIIKNNEILFHKVGSVIKSYPLFNNDNNANQTEIGNCVINKDKNININIYANYLFNYNNNRNSSNSHHDKGPKEVKDKNRFRTSNNSNIRNNTTTMNSKSAFKIINANMKSVKIGKVFINNYIKPKGIKEIKYSALLDIKDNSQLNLNEKKSIMTDELKWSRGEDKRVKVKNNYLNKSVLQKKVSSNLDQNIIIAKGSKKKLRRPNSCNNIHITNNKKKDDSLIDQSKRLAKTAFCYFPKTPKISFNNTKVPLSSLDDIFMKRRLCIKT